MTSLIKYAILIVFSTAAHGSKGSVTGGNTGDPTMARVENGRYLALEIIKNSDFFDGAFRNVDRRISEYFETSRHQLFALLASQELDWDMTVSDDSTCIARLERHAFELRAHLKSCKTTTKSQIARQILAETLEANGLLHELATEYSDKVMTEWDKLEAWRIANVRPAVSLASWERKELITRGRLYGIEKLTQLNSHNYPGGIVYPGVLTPRARFVLSHRDAMIKALKNTTLRWNWIAQQQTCAQMTPEKNFKVIDFRESLCLEILSLEDAAELLVHEAAHAIGIVSELEAIRTARSVMGGWNAAP